MLKVQDIRTEYRLNPMGIDAESPRFSWHLVSDKQNVKQTSYELTVQAAGQEPWTTKAVSEEILEIAYTGPKLQSRTRYTITVTVTDNYGEQATAESWFETGIAKEEWQAKWIESDHKVTTQDGNGGLLSKPTKRDPEEFLAPPTVFSKVFTVGKPVAQARLYATAHGVYDFTVNGVRTDDRFLAPDFTPYDKWLTYQTYDITDALQSGDNKLAITVADGWYSGCVGLTGGVNSYGKRHALLAQLEIRYEDGSSEIIASDESFAATEEEIVYADLYVGEKHDYTRESKALNVSAADHGLDILTASDKDPVRIWREIPCVEIFTDTIGNTVLDFGQVTAGFVRFTVRGEKGQVIGMEHGEILKENGEFFVNFEGAARQYDEFVLSGGEQQIQPRYTFHGFRYVRLVNFPEDIRPEDFTALALSSDTRDTLQFECNDPRLNRLWQNTVWSQKANTIAIPTDCPQREKAGWTGDMQVFSATIVQNTDSNAFLSSWLRMMAMEQMKAGQIPMIIPYVPEYTMIGNFFDHTSACWGDAVEVAPFRMYRAYGNKRILEQMYPSIQRWIGFIEEKAANHIPLKHRLNPKYWFNKKAKELQKYLWNTGLHYGDWMVPSKTSGSMAGAAKGILTKALVVPAYYCYTLQITAQIAEILGKTEDVKKYRATIEKVKEAYDYYYIRKDGTMPTDLQGVYVLTLHFGLIPEHKRENAAKTLIKMIEDNGNRLDTGFASTEFLLDTLCEIGRPDKAYELLWQEEAPSWLYEVKSGATSIWECWDAKLPNGKVQTVSYNHYAYGCVDDWIYRHIVGLTAIEPAYRKFRVEPHPQCGLTHVKESFRSPYGDIVVEWKNEDAFSLQVEVPVGTEAEIVLPNGQTHTVGSGTYSF